MVYYKLFKKDKSTSDFIHHTNNSLITTRPWHEHFILLPVHYTKANGYYKKMQQNSELFV